MFSKTSRRPRRAIVFQAASGSRLSKVLRPKSHGNEVEQVYAKPIDDTPPLGSASTNALWVCSRSGRQSEEWWRVVFTCTQSAVEVGGPRGCAMTASKERIQDGEVRLSVGDAAHKQSEGYTGALPTRLLCKSNSALPPMRRCLGTLRRGTWREFPAGCTWDESAGSALRVCVRVEFYTGGKRRKGGQDKSSRLRTSSVIWRAPRRRACSKAQRSTRLIARATRSVKDVRMLRRGRAKIEGVRCPGSGGQHAARRMHNGVSRKLLELE
ncbi:hypothetical protein FB451DRAFT_1369342 [Mycena latifolia]|nr:hypothetical protein FB451DRAFT_1369342 [Mycena latifolia]